MSDAAETVVLFVVLFACVAGGLRYYRQR